MNNEEKILLIKLLLEDIRGNWGWENGNRTELAYNLSKELYESTNNKNWDELCNCIAGYDTYKTDGRYFRDDFPDGYIGMNVLYNISENYKDKSEEFKTMVRDYITYPESAFNDYEV